MPILVAETGGSKLQISFYQVIRIKKGECGECGEEEEEEEEEEGGWINKERQAKRKKKANSDLNEMDVIDTPE